MDTPTNNPTTTTNPGPMGACRFRDESRSIDVLMPDGVVAFGIFDDGALNYGIDESSGAPSAEDITRLVRALPHHVLTDAVIETKLGTNLRVQIVYPKDASTSVAVVVHVHGHSCAKSTARNARRLMAKIAKRPPRVPA